MRDGVSECGLVEVMEPLPPEPPPTLMLKVWLSARGIAVVEVGRNGENADVAAAMRHAAGVIRLLGEAAAARGESLPHATTTTTKGDS